MKIYDATIYQIKDAIKLAEEMQDIPVLIALTGAMRILENKTYGEDIAEKIELQ